MPNVNNSLVAANELYTDSAVLNQPKNGQDYEPVVYILTSSEAGARRDASGKLPLTIKISEDAAERALFKKFGFDVDRTTDLNKLKALLKAGGESPFDKVKTEGAMIAYLNQKTGKYEIKASVEKSLYSQLQGKAAEVKSQIAKPAAPPANPSETIAARNNTILTPNNQDNGADGVLPILPGSVSPTIKDTILMPVAGGATADRTLLYHIQKKYNDTNLQGDNYQHIFDLAKANGISVKINDVKTIGNQYQVSFEINRADEAKIENFYRAEQTEVNRQIDVVDTTSRNSVGEKFAEGFFKGAWGSLGRNASMVYEAAKNPLGTAWKVGEALLQIPALPTKIGVGIGQAAVSLAKMTPEQRQSLVDELVNNGYTSLRDMPAADAAEAAGEIVGNLAMEAVLFKGASVGGKLALEGLQSLKTTEVGTAFLSKINALANATAKTVGEVKVPVKATVESVADLNGGTRPVIVTEKKSVIELMQNMEARAKQVLSGGEKAKAINLPAWEKLSFRIDPGEIKPHFLTGHEIGGSRLEQSIKAGGRKTIFPEWMSEKQITNAIKEAYNHSDKLGTQINPRTGEKVVELVGEGGGMKIKMYVNVTAKQLDSAFPSWGLK